MYVNADIGQAVRVSLAKTMRSQNWLSKEVEKSRGYISLICNNHRIPSIELTKLICKALDMPMSEFIKGGEE